MYEAYVVAVLRAGQGVGCENQTLCLAEVGRELAKVVAPLRVVGAGLPPARHLKTDHHAHDDNEHFEHDCGPVLLTDGLR